MNFFALLIGNKSFFGVILLIITLAGLGIYIKVLRNNLEICEAEKIAITTRLEISQESVKNLQGAINSQNIAIEKMKTAADERAKANQAELNRAKATADTFKQQATDILKNVAPQGVPKCDAANLLINSEIQRNAK